MPLKLTNTNAAYNGHTVPFADLRSGRAYGGRTASFRAYGGRTASFAPTAFPKKANRKEFTFCSAGKALQKQVSRFIKSKKGEIHGSRTAG